jgi:hypothetical protein
MTREARDTGIDHLEGLILHDGSAYYEVPCLVIERYRVSEQRHAEIAAARDADSSAEPVWIVYSGIYAPPSVSEGPA